MSTSLVTPCPASSPARAGLGRRWLDGGLVAVVRTLMRVMYRLRGRGLQHVPATGPGLLVCNHVSFIDALIVAAMLRRPVRFVMDHRLYHAPVLHTLMRMCGVIPIASRHEDPALLDAAYDRIAERLSDGELVAVFPEGQITRDGELNEFRRGVERIVARSPVPVVPLAVRGLWGSFFSRRGGPAMRRLPRRFRARIDVLAAAAVPAAAVTAADLQRRVAALRGEVC
jgi:1-acyl-sn-glycerol-3-phosphate acyltransferase